MSTSQVNPVEIEPKIISIQAAEACCESASRAAFTEFLGYVNSLVRELFVPPEPRQASVLRLGLPPNLTGVKTFTTTFEQIEIPLPLRVSPPNPRMVDFPSGSIEIDIPSDPTFETFTALASATAELMMRLRKARSKTCLKNRGFPPNNPRRAVAVTRKQTRK